MYLCGDTVYDYCHMGHARSKTAFDIVRRYFQYRGYQVTFVRNITDIDDNIIKRAHENGESVQALTSRFTKAMHEDYDRLGLLRPDFEPKATEHVPGIIRMIEQLIEKGYAYVASNGDVMYSVSKFDGYGKLSGRQLGDLRAGARVAVDEAKRDPLDFVLWKKAKPGEPKWPSPWGEGRPGWHIECSAMSTDLLGLHFDIHGGGMDLKFPHHENEIAQTCGATGAKFVNVWMHNGFVSVDDEKMSKSLNNFFTVREVLPQLRHPEVLRYFLLASHYRGPINYSTEPLAEADIQLNRIYTALRDLPAHAGPAPKTEHTTRFIEVMDDDFNTPNAFAVLQMMTREINTARDANKPAQAAALGAELRTLATVLNIGQLDPEEWFRRSATKASDSGVEQLTDAEVQRLVDARAAARARKDFAESDRIRDELLSKGIIVEDKGGKSTWRRK